MATKLLRESARLFIKADSNGDGQLDFREFVELVILQAKLQRRQEILNGTQKGKVGELPPMPSRAMLKDYFQLIDFNHSGTLSMTEFFAFSLREGLARGRTTVSTFLSVWDQDNNNMLNEDEFTRVCHALGFASITKELMKACEKDESGQIKITELTRVLRLKAEGDEKDDFFDEASKLAQRPIESLWARLGKKKRAIRNRTGQKVVHARRAVNQRGEMPQMDMKTSFAIVSELSKVDLSARKTPFYDASDEKIRAQEDITGALSILRSWMRKTGLTALDLFQAWDVNGSFSISAKELAEGLELYGLKLTIELVELVFDAMTDRYKLDYDQFKFYWKDLAGVSQKVALSALETHGSVEALLAGESSATIGNILEPEQLEAVRAVFKRLVGAETLARFAVANAADDDGDVSSPPPDDDEDEDEEEAHEEEAKPLDAAKSSGTKKEPTAPGPSSSGGSEVASNKKRKARMALVDELKREAAEAAAAEKAEKKAKSNGVRLVD